MTGARVVACLAVLALFGGLLFTQEPAKDKGAGKKAVAAADKKAPTHKVEKQPFQIERTVKGILTAEQAAEISYRPVPALQSGPGHAPQTIRTVAEHGARVKKGDVLVTFDTTKLDEAIADAVKEKQALEAGLKVAEEEVPLFEKSAPAELAAAESAKKRADEDLKYFLEIGRAQSVKSADMRLKSARFSMEYAIEELRQLEKMYKANDLTEETEKIVLRRQKHQVESATFYYKSAVLDHDYTMKHTLPNKETLLKEAQVKQEQLLDKARKTLAPMAAQKRASLMKMKHDREKNVARLERLKKDREALTLRSPIDGVVYHGKFHRGQWTLTDTLASKLIPSGTVAPDEVILTVVNPRPVVVHLTLDEKDVHLLKPGTKGTAKLLVNPDRKIPARVTKLATVPTTPGKYAAVVALDLGADDAQFMPGMACSVKFAPYSKKDALVVPARAVHDEDDKQIVYVARKGAKPEAREVRIGKTEGDQTEIVSGLREGEEILLERPGAKGSKKGPGAAADEGGE